MSAREMPNKDDCKPAIMSNDPNISNNASSVGRPEKSLGKSVGLKNSSTKISWKGVEVLPTSAAPDSPTEELLGSVTSSGGEGAVRTSARVIKKMKLDLAPSSISEKVTDSIRDFDKPEDSTLSKLPLDKQPTKLTKCRTPKALWSSTEKNLFFEALNEYGKDFDSITAYICNKMKRKSAPDSSTKAKHQVTTFYYRTWQKVSKYIKFDDNIKKVAQELYALINFGEMRKRMEGGISTSKLGVRLGELVRKGVVALRCRGRTLRVRTPVCRALRTLNQLHEWEEQLRLPVRVVVQLTARDSEAWRLVQGAAHNPRVLAPTPPSLRLCILLHLLSKRWNTPVTRDVVPDLHEKNSLDCFNNLECQLNALINPATQMPLKMEQTNILTWHSCLTDNKDSKTSDVSIFSKAVEDVMEENAGAKSSNNNTTNCTNGNDLFTDDILNKTGRRIETVNDSQKIDEVNKATKLDGNQQENVCTSGKLYLHVGPKPGLTFSLPTISIGEHLTSQRICLDSYQERLRNNSLFNGLQNGTGFKGGGRFKNQKRNRKDSGEIESIKGDSKKIKTDSDNLNCDSNKQDLFDIDETANDGMDIVDFKIIDDDEKDKDFLSELEEDVECEGDKPREPIDETKQNIKIKMCDKTKKESQKLLQQQLTDSPEDGKSGNGVAVPSSVPGNGALKNWNKDVLLQQIKRGWSTEDAGDLTIGDLYLMFGSESKLEMEYWWTEASLPMQQKTKPPVPIDGPLAEPETPLTAKVEFDKEVCDVEKDPVDMLLMSPTHVSQDSNDTEKEMMSPDHRLSQQSDSLAVNGFPLVSKIINGQPNAIQSPPGSTDSRSPEQKETAPLIVPNRERTTGIGPRLKKLLSLAKLYDAKGTKTGCTCGHFCASSRLKFRNVQTLRDDLSMRTATEYPWQRGNLSGSQDNIQFRTPLPKPTLRTNAAPNNTDLGLDKLPPWTKRGGRPRQLNNVMPQRFTILPRPVIQSVTSLAIKTSQISTNTSNTAMNSSTSLKILPKLKPKPCVVTVRPSLTIDKNSPASSNSSMNYAMDIKSEATSLSTDSIKTSLSSANQTMDDGNKNNMVISSSKLLEGTESDMKWSEIVKQEMVDVTPNLANLLDISLPSNICDDNSIGISFKSHQSDAEEKHDTFTGLLPAESMSMSPSRLLKENDDQWLESEVHNFSLSSFLGHLEGPNGNSSAPSKLSKPDEETNTVDTPLHCLMNDSIDYVAKFEDLSKTS